LSVRIEAWNFSFLRFWNSALWSSWMFTAPSAPPYTMPGTLPTRRRRRLAPVPCASRFSALISNFIDCSLVEPAPATRRRSVSKRLFDKKRADRFLGVDAQDRLGEEPGDRKAPDLAAAACILAQRNGVGDHQLVEVGLGDALDRRTRQHRVRAVRHHLGGAFLLQHLG